MDFELSILNPKDISKSELNNIAQFVGQFGQVDMSFILAGLPKSEKIGFIKIDNKIVSVGVLKNPSASYIQNTYTKAGLDVPGQLIYEYGYAGTDEKHRGKGFSSIILKQLLNSLPKNQKVFATVRQSNAAEIHILRKHYFCQVGKDYPNASGEYNLKLFQFTKGLSFSFRFSSK
uniref:N-acetyltransferase domain-containing protein n=1 Tax=viral metagenome TaxID=1070528 RepID=A0A6C0KRX9_9ZZZZ